MVTWEQVLLSVLVNGVALIVVFYLKSAPPRVVLYVCLVGMSAILVPWSYIGTGFERYIPSNAMIEAGIPSSMPVIATLNAVDSHATVSIAAVLLLIGITWLVVSILQAESLKKVWRSKALCGMSLLEYGNPVFSGVMRRVRVHRLPNSSLVFATGLWRPEIWIGSDIRSPAQIEAAINHELAHITVNDQLTLFSIVALERLFWWNPLIWMLGRQARLQMEYACDARCQSLIGTAAYRKSLAELFFVQQPRVTSLELTLGNKSDMITRLEKIGMTHLIKPSHIFTLLFAGSLTAIASASIAAQSHGEVSTLMECQELLPEGVQYDFRIRSEIDTREGLSGDLSVTLLDASKPDSHDIPAGAGEFLSCIKKVVGVGEPSDRPKT